MFAQKRMFVLVMAIFVVVGTVTVLSASTNSMGVAQKQEITFSAPTVVGGTLLPAGDYKVLHEMNGAEHIMVFKQIGGKAEVKAKCSLVPLPEKSKTTEQRYTENAKNEHVLVEMQFRGDMAKHVLVQ